MAYFYVIIHFKLFMYYYLKLMNKSLNLPKTNMEDTSDFNSVDISTV